jgi:hypothetical protein
MTAVAPSYYKLAQTRQFSRTADIFLNFRKQKIESLQFLENGDNSSIYL